MLEHYLAALESEQPGVVNEAVMQCGLLLEKGTLEDDVIENLLSKLVKLFATAAIDTQSGIIWVIGKSQRQEDIGKLRYLFPAAWELQKPDLFWQWLVAYENLAGSTILQPDLSIFEKLTSVAGSDRRLGKALPRFTPEGV